MTLDTLWEKGDVAYYVLPRTPRNGRPQTLYLAVEVVNVTDFRIVVRDRGRHRRGHRCLLPDSLVRTPPEGAWVRDGGGLA